MHRLVLVAYVACAVLLSATIVARAEQRAADFSGVYLGLQTSYGFGAGGDWCFCTFVPPALDAAGGEGGILVGGEAGYGLRLGALVVEAEGRLSYSDVAFAELCAPNLRCEGELSWLGETQVSVGFIVMDDILIAATAGLATGEVTARASGAGVSDEDSSIHNGVTFGARVEQGMIGGWRFGLEYRYYDMSGDNTLTPGTGAPAPVDIDWHAHVAGLTIRYELND
jgi:outer membrane immunogenic protein